MNTKIYLVFIGLTFSFAVKAQPDCYERLENKAVEIERLKLKISHIRDSFGIIIRHLRDDSIRLLTTVQLLQADSVEFARFQPEIKELKKIRLSNETLLKDTIGMYQTKIRLQAFENNYSLLDQRIRVLSSDSANCVKINTKYENFIESFKGKFNASFMQLLESSSIVSLESDLKISQILDMDKNIQKDINDALIYKRAEAVLNKKYDKATCDAEISKLQTIKENKVAGQLVEILKQYEIITVNLQSTIKDIQKKDLFKAEKIENLIAEKRKDFFLLIEDFIKVTEVDLIKYKYLNQVITDLKKRKNKNIDANIDDLLMKL